MIKKLEKYLQAFHCRGYQLNETYNYFLGILVPSSIPRTIFGGKRAFPTYNLSPDGEKACSTILYSLYHVHPDIQFAPLLPPLTALFLHFMDESDCYTCMHALVNSRRSILDQSRWDYEVMAQTFQDSLKLYSVS